MVYFFVPLSILIISSIGVESCPVEVKSCNDQDPFNTLFGSLNASLLSSSSILAERSTAASLHDACETYEKFLSCSKSFESNRQCLVEYDKKQAYFDFICKSLLPNVDNGTCWRSPSCKLAKVEKSTRTSCRLLSALQLQIDCALEQSENCSWPSMEFLRQARTDNFNLISTMDCNDDDVDEQINSTMVPKCSEKQNVNAKVCEKYIVDIQRYVNNGTFWIDMISNSSMVNELCDHVSKHQKCVEMTFEQSDDSAAQMPCVFDDPLQNFPAFVQTMCNNDILRYQLYPTCRAAFVASPDFSPTSETLCSMYNSSIAYFDSLKIDDTACADKIGNVKSNIMDDALIFKCSPTKPSEACNVELTKQCEKFRLNFISITSSPIKDYCSAEQLLETCIACNAVNLPLSVTSIHNFVCGPGANDYQKSRPCLFSALDDQNVKSCFKIDDLNNLNDTSTICPTANKLVNCTLPIIDRLCGGMASQFHMNIMHNFAMSSVPNCILEGKATQAEDALSTILAYENCSVDEKMTLNECAEPFRKLLADLESTTKGGLSSIVGSLKNVTNAVKEGCKLRNNFQRCVEKTLSPSTDCQIFSCSIKVGDTACQDNVTAKSLEKDIRCMFTLITDSKFQQCMKIFPKDTFNNLSKLKPYFPQFIACIREPVLRKCGERSWQLARSFTSGKNDSSCILDFDGARSVFKTENGSMSDAVESTNGAANSTNDAVESTNGVVNSTNDAIDSTTLCTTERLDQFKDCANVLGDYKPMPIILFDDQSKIDKACQLYNSYQNCLKKYKCHYPLAEAYKSLLYNVCTTYYDAYKTNAACLKRVLNNNKVQTCVNQFRSTDLRSASAGLADLGCRAVTDMLKCAGDVTDFACGQNGLNFLYDVYRPFAQKFLASCSPSRTDIGPPLRDCTREQRDMYYKCRNPIKLNPIAIFDDSDHFNRTCSYFVDGEFQACVDKTPCTPQPAHQAFNDTMNYVCSTEQTRRDFETFNACLLRVAATTAGRRCWAAFDNITWDDGGKIVCRKLNQALDCGYPLIAEARCHRDSPILIYNVYSLLAMRYRTGCVLNVPPNVQMPDRTKNVTLAQPIFLTDNIPTTMSPSPESATKGASGRSLRLSVAAFCLLMLFFSLL